MSQHFHKICKLAVFSLGFYKNSTNQSISAGAAHAGRGPSPWHFDDYKVIVSVIQKFNILIIENVSQKRRCCPHKVKQTLTIIGCKHRILSLSRSSSLKIGLSVHIQTDVNGRIVEERSQKHLKLKNAVLKISWNHSQGFVIRPHQTA